METNEAFSRVAIDAQLADQGWRTQDPNSFRYEVMLGDGTRADYVLCDRHGGSNRSQRESINPAEAEAQARNYAQQLGVPYIFLANRNEIRFWEWERDVFPRLVKTFFKQDDLERRLATRQLRRDPLALPIDQHIERSSSAAGSTVPGGRSLYEAALVEMGDLPSVSIEDMTKQ